MNHFLLSLIIIFSVSISFVVVWVLAPFWFLLSFLFCFKPESLTLVFCFCFRLLFFFRIFLPFYYFLPQIINGSLMNLYGNMVETNCGFWFLFLTGLLFSVNNGTVTMQLCGNLFLGFCFVFSLLWNIVD